MLFTTVLGFEYRDYSFGFFLCHSEGKFFYNYVLKTEEDGLFSVSMQRFNSLVKALQHVYVDVLRGEAASHAAAIVDLKTNTVLSPTFYCEQEFGIKKGSSIVSTICPCSWNNIKAELSSSCVDARLVNKPEEVLLCTSIPEKVFPHIAIVRFCENN